MSLSMRRADRLLHSRLFAQLARFAMIGAGRTAISLGIYLLLTLIVPYWLAFTVAYVASITFSALMNARFVFLVGLDLGAYIRYVGVYSVNYILSLGLLIALVEGLSLPPVVAPLLVVAIMFPLNFVTERYALLPSRRRTAKSE
jgi:putative flippase GtrA